MLVGVKFSILQNIEKSMSAKSFWQHISYRGSTFLQFWWCFSYLIFSYPIWFCNDFCGSFSLGPITGSYQQYIWNSIGCLQIHHSNAKTNSTASTRYWHLVQHIGRNDILGSCIQRNTSQLKFMFSKKATKIDEIFTVDLTLCCKCQIDGEDCVNFCGIHRKHEL